MAPTGKTLASPTRCASRQDEFDLALVVQGRFGVGHAADRREPAGDGGRGAAGDGLFLLVARLAEMHVNVDQPRRDEAPRGVDQAIGFARGSTPIPATFPSRIEQIRPLLQFLRGIEDRAVLDQDAGHNLTFMSPPA